MRIVTMEKSRCRERESGIVVWKEWEIYYLGEGGRDRKI
jgi:hypothetical protein